MRVIETDLPGLLLIEPGVFEDPRGFFMETYRQSSYRDAGVTETFVQDNCSFSRRGTLRGLHFQEPTAQAKLIHVLQGAVYDVAVDVRVGSPHFGQWLGLELSAENKRQLYIPRGFAHGFCVTSETAVLVYKCDDYYAAEHARSIAWDDPELAVDWPVTDPVLSAADRRAPRLSEATFLPKLDEA